MTMNESNGILLVAGCMRLKRVKMAFRGKQKSAASVASETQDAQILAISSSVVEDELPAIAQELGLPGPTTAKANRSSLHSSPVRPRS